jgi:hypothetical protein
MKPKPVSLSIMRQIPKRLGSVFETLVAVFKAVDLFSEEIAQAF